MHIVQKLETENQWLKRLAKDLKKELPLLRVTKTIRGHKITCMVNHYGRLKKIIAKEGHAGIKKYCDQRVKFYNDEIIKKQAQ